MTERLKLLFAVGQFGKLCLRYLFAWFQPMDVKADHEPHTQGLHRTANTVVDVVKHMLDFTSKSTLILDHLRELHAALELLDTLTNLVGKIILPV